MNLPLVGQSTKLTLTYQDGKEVVIENALVDLEPNFIDHSVDMKVRMLKKDLLLSAVTIPETKEHWKIPSLYIPNSFIIVGFIIFVAWLMFS